MGLCSLAPPLTYIVTLAVPSCVSLPDWEAVPRAPLELSSCLEAASIASDLSRMQLAPLSKWIVS